MAQDGRRSIRQHFPSLPFVGALAIVLALGAAAFIYLGVYNIAADEPHTPAVYSMLERLRDRSIEARARGITPRPIWHRRSACQSARAFTEKCVPVAISAPASRNPR